MPQLVLSTPSPVIAGGLYDPQAPQIVFYYIAALFAVSAVVLMLLPLRQPVYRTEA